MENLRQTLAVSLIAFSAATMAQIATAGLPAFPGAEGGGALSQGGRGGQILYVTTLKDYDYRFESVIPGTFRWAVQEMTGPRIVVFRVGGTIELKRNIELNSQHSHLTIAGQTAPGGGIQLSGAKIEGWTNSPCSGRTPLVIAGADHVIVRYLRVRTGRGFTDCSGGPDVISITGTSKDIMLDHLSLFWAQDETFNINGFTSSSPVSRVTLQNSILAEPREGHATSALYSARSAEARTRMFDIDLLRNYLVNSTHRNPAAAVKRTRFINNIVYNGRIGGIFGAGVNSDVIGNLYKMGPLGFNTNRRYDISTYGPNDWDSPLSMSDNPSVYVAGNKGRFYVTDPTADNWPMVRRLPTGPHGDEGGVAPTEWRRHIPLPPPHGIPISILHANDIEKVLLPWVGASRRLDCEGNWVPNRDSQDDRVIGEYFTNGGGLVSHEAEVGGFPVLEAGIPCVDTSGDGVPDEWAMKNGLDHGDSSLGARVHPSGYTYLELYLSGMQLGGLAPAAPPSGINVR